MSKTTKKQAIIKSKFRPTADRLAEIIRAGERELCKTCAISVLTDYRAESHGR